MAKGDSLEQERSSFSYGDFCSSWRPQAVDVACPSLLIVIRTCVARKKFPNGRSISRLTSVVRAGFRNETGSDPVELRFQCPQLPGAPLPQCRPEAPTTEPTTTTPAGPAEATPASETGGGGVNGEACFTLMASLVFVHVFCASTVFHDGRVLRCTLVQVRPMLRWTHRTLSLCPIRVTRTCSCRHANTRVLLFFPFPLTTLYHNALRDSSNVRSGLSFHFAASKLPFVVSSPPQPL